MTQKQRIDWRGRVLRLQVAGPAHGGEFVARSEGRVVFCRGGITGEMVEVLVDDDPGRAYCRGTVLRVLEAAPERVDPRCPAAAAGAGCCDWSHIDPVSARRFAGIVVAEQAARIGKIAHTGGQVPVDPPAGDSASTGWRTVARWFTGSDGVPGVRRARSHEIITSPCAQPDPRIVAAVAEAGIEPGREILGVLDDDGSVHVAHRAVVDSSDRIAPRGSGRSGARSRSRHTRVAEWEHASGPRTIVRRVGSRVWELPPGAFWQAHRSAASFYSDIIGRLIATTVGSGVPPRVWDLYGGAGLFSAAALDAGVGAQVTLVETATDSIRSAKTMFDEGGEAVRTVGQRVETFLSTAQQGRAGERPDIVVLDPPRGGAGIQVMSRLATVTRSRIIHVGCDAASLARDVGVLTAAGWQLRELTGIAAFPGTHHVEGLAVLDSPTTDEPAVGQAVE